jgi:hypothetical protein
MARTLEELRHHFGPLFADTGGIDSWISAATPPDVVERLWQLDEVPLSVSVLNQLLLLGHEAGVSEGFFRYYWLQAPHDHPYRVDAVPGYDPAWTGATAIISLDHLRWGLYRFYTDALLYFGSIRTAFRDLRERTEAQLVAYFDQHRQPVEYLKSRSDALPLRLIPMDQRYLISEMACKSLAPQPGEVTILTSALVAAFAESQRSGQAPVKIRDLVDGPVLAGEFRTHQFEIKFTADEFLDQAITTPADVLSTCADLGKRFETAREAALQNTRLYLSMVGDLDVYVATSMRNRDDFRTMAAFCDRVFGDPDLQALHARYFDPTLSGAEGHEDKGLIECLMVKCAKALVYSAGSRDSWGKDAEASMALSLGKPVIFFCSEEVRRNLFQSVHPLTRLINFSTGVAVGAMIVTKEEQVVELLRRILTNTLEYAIEQPHEGYLRLVERVSGCTVRLQTSDKLLRETFWNYYHPG